ncbi:unnamed protein product [Polarella glacialis]|uniref:Photosystem I reaction center subunit IV n=1 Tax=Polarella glacialis TaxID=89957 RepID=A0A813DX33_POLGL|nr:unnamed protein product [Polarella glacialis]|eukprot:CAMPEP_0115107564 /NCGR_PEP_ID=MMETSP0227-20121206/37398_1 /TAXON_ID=89957 /ORGANISM="Polarella glacialis, Strain CCMP 1383" /LENGTH=127 /DNA_ID=CAMNT_0002505521 /DNA_START=48 /DNA_END=431 /DNA_ORIENTATION=-
MARSRSSVASLLVVAAVSLTWLFVAPSAFAPSRGRVALRAVDVETEAPAKKAKAAWVGPQKGAWVRILRPESYWFQQRGTVVNVNQKPEIKYPVTVKFDLVNYANVNTNGFALWEVEEADAPGPGEL